jgi:hypothetical protein
VRADVSAWVDGSTVEANASATGRTVRSDFARVWSKSLSGVFCGDPTLKSGAMKLYLRLK